MKHHKKLTWRIILQEEQERHVTPLNLNINLQRLTQLFGRSLYIKYFIKPVDQNLIRKKSLSIHPEIDPGMDAPIDGYDDGPYHQHED